MNSYLLLENVKSEAKRVDEPGKENIENIIEKSAEQLLDLISCEPEERKQTLVAVADSEDEAMQLFLKLTGLEDFKKKFENELHTVNTVSYQFEENREAKIKTISAQITEIDEGLDNHRTVGKLEGVEPQDTEIEISNSKIEAKPLLIVDTDETLVALFDLVTKEVLEKMFPTNGQWNSWAEKTKANGLSKARVGRAMFNPYTAAMWFLNRKVIGYDLARINRILVKNLPKRSCDYAYLINSEIE